MTKQLCKGAVIDDGLKIYDWLIEDGFLKGCDHREEIKGSTTCKFCNNKIKYWQSAYNGHRGFQCEVCVDNMIFQE